MSDKHLSPRRQEVVSRLAPGDWLTAVEANPDSRYHAAHVMMLRLLREGLVKRRTRNPEEVGRQPYEYQLTRKGKKHAEEEKHDRP